MPLPLNQSTKRLSMAFSPARAGGAAAYAVPCELNIETSGGIPTTICEPAAVRPLRIDRRESLTRFVITCDMNSPSCVGKFPQTNHGDDHLFVTEPRLPEVIQYLPDNRPIRQCLQPSCSISKILLDRALLALRALGQNGAQL